MEQRITFTISKSELLSHLVKVCRAVQDKSTLPLYTFILFEIIDSKLYLTVTDSELQIESSLKLTNSNGNMSFCTDKSIVGILKTLPEHPLEFEIIYTPNKDPKKSASIQVNMKHSSGNNRIAGMDAKDYVKMKSVDGKCFDISTSKLIRGLNKTKTFANIDTSRPNVSVVYFDIQEDCLTFASTNGFIVSRFKDKSLSEIDAEGFLLRINAANHLSLLLDSTKEEQTKITVGKTNVLFEFGDIKLLSRLQEGKFVNYNSVFQEGLPMSFSSDSKTFSNAINRLLLTSGSSSLIQINMDLSGVKLHSNDVVFEKSSDETLDCTNIQGQINIGFKGTHLLDMLNIVSGNAILFFSDPSKPMQMKPEDQDEQTDYTLLVVPLMLQN